MIPSTPQTAPAAAQIVILNQYYWPHGSATSQLMTELAEGLTARGHTVTVVASRTADRPDHRLSARETRRGVHIRRAWATRFGKRRLIGRLLDYATFYLGALWTLARLGRPDVVLALTTPPLIAVTAQLTLRRRGAALVSLVQDVYPDIAVSLGVVSAKGPLTRLWRRLAGASLRRSDAVIVLSDAMRRRVMPYGIRDGQVHVVHNWALAEMETPPTPVDNPFRAEAGYGDRFVVAYSGNMGAAHSFETVLEAAAQLQARDDILFVFIGGGVRRQEIAEHIQREGLLNVRMRPYVDRETLSQSMGAAQVHLVTMRDHVEGLVMPSKLYGILAAARPVIFVGPAASEVTRIIETSACGTAVGNGDVDRLVHAITQLADAPSAAREQGARARARLLETFAREDAISRYETVLNDAITARRADTPEDTPPTPHDETEAKLSEAG